MLKSFVRRQGRMTPLQRHARATLWESYGLTVQEVPMNFQAIFGNDNPLILEIGFGMGHSLLEMATQEPQHNFIGVDVHQPGIGALLHGVAHASLSNVRVFAEDAVTVLRQCIAQHTLQKILIFFPDPWPKKRHHKRRLIQRPFLDLLAEKLILGGMLHLATDWASYAEQMMDVLSAHPLFTNVWGEQQFAPVGVERSATKFEERGKRLGHDVWDLQFVKR